MSPKSDVVARALKHLPDLESIENRLETEPHALLSAAFEGARARPAAAGRPGLESMGAAGAGEIHTAVARVEDAVAQAAKRALAKVRKDRHKAVLTDEEQVGLEAIIRVTGRPAILIEGGTFRTPPPEWARLADERDQIDRTIRSVGRIEVNGHPELEWIGTGFLVGDNVVMTNRHVAKEFCRSGGRGKWTFEPGMTARIDYAEELGTTKPREFGLTAVIGVHEKYDLALFRALDGLVDPDGVEERASGVRGGLPRLGQPPQRPGRDAHDLREHLRRQAAAARRDRQGVTRPGALGPRLLDPGRQLRLVRRGPGIAPGHRPALLGALPGSEPGRGPC
jgi:hypothetical protein